MLYVTETCKWPKTITTKLETFTNSCLRRIRVLNAVNGTTKWLIPNWWRILNSLNDTIKWLISNLWGTLNSVNGSTKWLISNLLRTLNSLNSNDEGITPGLDSSRIDKHVTNMCIDYRTLFKKKLRILWEQWVTNTERTGIKNINDEVRKMRRNC